MRKIFNALKSKLFGAKPQVERRKGSRSSRMPVFNDYVVYHRVKMRICSENSQELCKWLVKYGWRVADYKNDRRRYVLLSDSAYDRLFAAPPSERPMIIRAFMRHHGLSELA